MAGRLFSSAHLTNAAKVKIKFQDGVFKKKTTYINEVARKRLDITRDEYALCSYIQYRQADDRGKVLGWCSDPKEMLADFVGVTRPGLYKMVRRMCEKNLLFFDQEKSVLRVTSHWIDTEQECKQSLQNSEKDCKQSLQSTVNKVYTKEAETVNKVYTPIIEGNYLVRKEGKEKIEIPENLKNEKFTSAFLKLVQMPKWKKKPDSAVDLSLKKLSRYHPDFAAALVENSIMGNYQGVVFPDTDAKYEQWKQGANAGPSKNGAPHSGRATLNALGGNPGEYTEPQAF